MKKVIYATLLVAITMISCKDNKNSTTEPSQEVAVIEANTEASFGVRGNCEMCKKTIETAALGIPGVTHANWDVKLKKIDVKFNSEMTDQMAIHHAIAASGYDTDQMTAEDASYQNLPKCCQYDHSMEMSINDSEATMDHQMHESH
jgi:copper chaperone CopZ